MISSTRVIFVCFVIFPFLGAGCAGSLPEKPAQSAPATESTAPAPAEQEESLDRAGAAPAPQAAPPAAGAPMPSSSKAEGERAAVAPDMDAWARQMESALTLATPDCTTAWALRDKICDLAQRLCDIAGRSAEPEVADRCTDGKSRCARATARVRAGCAE